jgi:hypothetical protein
MIFEALGVLALGEVPDDDPPTVFVVFTVVTAEPDPPVMVEY